MDASDQCHEAAFNFGASAMTARTWDIKVTQFTCTEEMGGENGLQKVKFGRKMESEAL